MEVADPDDDDADDDCCDDVVGVVFVVDAPDLHLHYFPPDYWSCFGFGNLDSFAANDDCRLAVDKVCPFACLFDQQVLLDKSLLCDPALRNCD
jgi:hypothetical protein